MGARSPKRLRSLGGVCGPVCGGENIIMGPFSLLVPCSGVSGWALAQLLSHGSGDACQHGERTRAQGPLSSSCTLLWVTLQALASSVTPASSTSSSPLAKSGTGTAGAVSAAGSAPLDEALHSLLHSDNVGTACNPTNELLMFSVHSKL